MADQDLRDVLEELVDRLDWESYKRETVKARVLTDNGWEYCELEGPVVELLGQIKEWLDDN